MVILANAYFDVVAAARGFVVLLFCVPIVLLCEYEVYRIIYPRQGRIRAIITCIYANVISWIAGIFLAEGVLDLTVRISRYLFGKENDVAEESILFVFLFFLTWLIEAVAIYFFRRKLRVQKILMGVGLANLVSYVVSAIVLYVFLGN